ncbi:MULTISPECIES: SGNH/GDSL hydrolase family protein [unclassified Novosphingobium]|uniref:SGNH/GDSL hydrolase family protein n=1 Tax=unclassified Novosphingobium TaxID=2644732 RepID=UPI0025F173F8|nr:MULTISPECIES: SGNH/GDSL hydrolase family protein [unclassified Novosphingobium]
MPHKIRQYIIRIDRPKFTRFAACAAILFLIAGGTILALRDEVPLWRAGGTDPVRSAPLPALGAYPIALAAGRPIVFLGDSNTAGTRTGGPHRAYPALLAVPARAAAIIDNRAFGGATVPLVAQGLSPFSRAQVVVVMLGTNDAAPRRYLGKRHPVALDDFRIRLTTVVRNAMGEGVKVLILAAPPAGSVAMNARIAPYRHAARDVAAQTGVHFHDPAASLDGLKHESAAFLLHDGLHVSDAGQAILARWLDTLFVEG